MRPHLLVSLMFSLALAACGVVPPSPSQSADERFRAHTARVLDEMWSEFPELGIRVGHYENAGRMNIPDQARRDRSRAFYRRQLADLQGFDPASLNRWNRIDHAVLKNRFEHGLWQIDTFKAWQWQPSQYNVANEFDLLLTTEYAPLDFRLRHVLDRLAGVPAYYAAARASISDATLEHTQLAILQNKGTLRVFTPDLMKQVDASGLTPAEKALFIERVQAARTAINDFIAYLGELETRLRAGHARSFRIGKALYEQKFGYDIQSGFTAGEL